jgi:chloramphenicol-sensitive protein RarD
MAAILRAPRATATIAGFMNPGLLYAGLAFGIWGLYPLYLLQIASVPPLEVVLHRSAWSLLFLLGLLAVLKRWSWLPAVARQPRQLALFATSALLLSANWLVYVFAVMSGQVLEASLGYFINPLVSVLLGVLVLHERLRPVQWLAVALAAAGRGLADAADRPPALDGVDAGLQLRRSTA